MVCVRFEVKGGLMEVYCSTDCVTISRSGLQIDQYHDPMVIDYDINIDFQPTKYEILKAEHEVLRSKNFKEKELRRSQVFKRNRKKRLRADTCWLRCRRIR